MIFYRHIALVCSGAVIEVNWNGNRGNSQKPGPTFGFYVILWFYVAVFAVSCWSVSFLWIIWSKQGQKVNTEIGFLIAFFLPCDRCLLCSFPVDQDSRMNVSISNLRDDVYFRRCFLTRWVSAWPISICESFPNLTCSISMHIIFNWIEATRRWQKKHPICASTEAMIAFSEGIVLTALMFFSAFMHCCQAPRRGPIPAQKWHKNGEPAGWKGRYWTEVLGGSSHDGRKWLITMVIVFVP